ncbi:MAG: tryptophan 7-halogenase [Rhodospirillales bacterium]|nr:tryptophan 7-halogenase [Rhodospirillales bacterium]
MRTVDVAVIGGGPAGATVATLCAQNGLDVELYEREARPRYRIGESLLPATPQHLLPLLGAADDIARANFVVKPGVTFSWGDRPDVPWDLFFQGAAALNVDRERFDVLLLDNARAQGVTVRKGETVLSVGEGDSIQGRTVEVGAPPDGGRRRVRARYVADASGQMRFRLPELRARTHSRFFRKVAVWSYWKGATRLSSPLEGNVLFETLETESGPAWVWFIPLSDTLTSVGVVAPRECARALQVDRRSVLDAWVEQCPRTAALLVGARPATEPPYHEVRVCADYSYASDAFWAPGLVRVGDAACFADVLLSSGVHLATYGALLAARSIEAVLRGRMSEPLAMDEYESRTRQEFAIFYAGISGLYDMTRSRDHYIQPLRDVLSHSNGVRMEAGQFTGVTGGLNIARAGHAEFTPEREAARNVRTMRDWNGRALLYDGPPRNVPIGELPAIRNVLTVSPDGRGWRLPGQGGRGRATER